MILLHKMLNGLAALFSHAALWPVLWVLVLVGFSVLMLRLSRTLKTSRPWLVRKGECPFCGRELFGTTRTYQRLPLLKTLAPESKYLCISCDQEKVAGLLSTLEEER